MKTIEQLEQYVFELCQKETNKFGLFFFGLHIKMVEKYSLQLAQEFHADTEVVQIAALLHDVAAISDFSVLVTHAEKGAEMAEELLHDFDLSAEQKEKVAQCILSHSKPLAHGVAIPEAVCLSNADAMSQITEPLFWVFYIFGVRGFSYADGRKWYEQRVTDNWRGLVNEAKKMIEPEFQRTLRFFQ
jgi:uncharacterized protein